MLKCRSDGGVVGGEGRGFEDGFAELFVEVGKEVFPCGFQFLQ